MKRLCYIFALLGCACAFAQDGKLSDATTNAKTNTFVYKGRVIVDYSTTAVPAWRFAHDGKALELVPFFSGGVTYTPHKIVECKTLAEATNTIIKLGIKVTEAQWEEIRRLSLDEKADVPKLAGDVTP